MVSLNLAHPVCDVLHSLKYIASYMPKIAIFIHLVRITDWISLNFWPNRFKFDMSIISIQK